MRTKEIVLPKGVESRNLMIRENLLQMAEIRQFRSAVSGAVRQIAVPKFPPTLDIGPNPERYCVYNQTRERFVATDVEAAGASPQGAEARLRTLEEGAGIGLWILPYLEISPTSIRFPLDLVFLGNDCVVLGMVESFPLASLPAWSAKALSVLALPADTLAKGEMTAGLGNAVTPPVANWITERCLATLRGAA